MALLPVAQDETIDLPVLRVAPTRPDEPLANTLQRARGGGGTPMDAETDTTRDGVHVLLATLLYLTLDDARISESLVRVVDGALDDGGHHGLARGAPPSAARWANFTLRALGLGAVEVHVDEAAGSGVERTWRKGRLHLTQPGHRAPRLAWDAPQRVTQAFAPAPPSAGAR
jgi:hypothetical protein